MIHDAYGPPKTNFGLAQDWPDSSLALNFVLVCILYHTTSTIPVVPSISPSHLTILPPYTFIERDFWFTIYIYSNVQDFHCDPNLQFTPKKTCGLHLNLLYSVKPEEMKIN
jgi:hypothetical protein